jgi:cytochrome c-type biogenesis protein CcmF
VLSAALSIWGEVKYDKHGLGFLVGIHVALWAAIYTVIANAHYLAVVLKWKMKAAGSSIAHFGFGLMLVGILISASKKELISRNAGGISVTGLKDAKGRDDDPLENVTLLYNTPVKMGKYVVTYLGDSAVEKNNKVFFKIRFIEVDPKDDETIVDAFNITPTAFLVKSGESSQLSSNPGSQHYISNDVFVYITSWLNPDNLKDTANFRYTDVEVGDTVFYSNGFAVVNNLVAANKNDNKDLPMVDSAWVSDVEIFSKEGVRFNANPAYLKKDGIASTKVDTIMEQHLVVGLQRAENGKVQLGLKESNTVVRYITMKAFRFPWINLLWLGTLITVFGFMISMWFRIKSKLYVA